MKRLLPVSLIIMSTLLYGCSTNSPADKASNYLNKQEFTASTPKRYPAKNPAKIALYEKDAKPQAAYRVIGVAKISKYNLLGMKRKADTMQAMMKKLAASVGGDALIDVDQTPEAIQANIIQYQKILI